MVATFMTCWWPGSACRHGVWVLYVTREVSKKYPLLNNIHVEQSPFTWCYNLNVECWTWGPITCERNIVESRSTGIHWPRVSHNQASHQIFAINSQQWPIFFLPLPLSISLQASKPPKISRPLCFPVIDLPTKISWVHEASRAQWLCTQVLPTFSIFPHGNFSTWPLHLDRHNWKCSYLIISYCCSETKTVAKIAWDSGDRSRTGFVTQVHQNDGSASTVGS